ncbi:DNA repair protein RAD50-like [Penaeus japonicus]|uniref:DNA repair protein RAD50-like n=1 Tax=Penaeus japonicus TaxID=27405 RepID=UPI001C71243E|nr:DNA repair protein RAD50-like [Penaeus japonicus]
MSKLEKMQIMGIRSFGPEEPRKIQFFSPLTLILGQNGCGKTTIIESLKYITTGDAPPGCGKGASFVHDPKLAKEVTVRGQIKLMLKDTKGATLVTTRSLEATQKLKKIECKTIDATLQRRRPDGTADAISSKCADFEAEISSSLGVSKPILNNVIFCHQEESNWPLDEGKKVKEKFDAIFNATKYIKCLETIRKLRAEMKTKVKNMNEVIDGLKKWRDEANRKRVDLKESCEQQNKIKVQKSKLKEELEPIRHRLKEICDLEENVGRLNGDLIGEKHKLEALRQSQADLRATLSEQLDCSDEELYRMIQDFQRNLESMEAEQEKVMSKMQNIQKEKEKNQVEMSKTERLRGEYEASYKTQQDYIKERNRRMSSITKEFSFAEFMGVEDFNEEHAQSLLSKLLKVVEEERKKIAEKKEEFEMKEQAVQKEIDGLRTSEAALDHDIKTKGKQLDETGMRIRQLKQRLMRNESDLSDTDLDSLKVELTQVEQMIAKEEAKVNMSELTAEIETAKKNKREGEHEIDEIKRVVAKMNRQANARSQYDIHMKEKKELENKIEFLKRKHADEFEHLLEGIPDDNIKNKVDACADSLRRRVTELRRDIEGLNKRRTQLSMSIKGQKQQQSRKEQEIRELESKIDSICEGANLDEALEKSKEVKDNLTRERGDLSSCITVFNRFTAKLRQRDCCPLCHRDFPSKDEVNQLIEELEGKVISIPGKLEEVKIKLDKQEKVHDQMIQLKPQRNLANSAKLELDKIRAQIEEEMKELAKVDSDLESQKEMLDMTQGDEEMARQIQPDVITIENNMRKVKQLKDQIDDLQATLGSSDGGMTMEEAVTKQSELEDKLRKLQGKVEELQEQLQEHKDCLQGLKDRKLRLSTQELELKTKLQETEKLKEDVAKLEEERNKLTEDIEKAQMEIAPFKFQITTKTSEKTKLMAEKDSWIDTQNNKVGTILETHRKANDLHRNISSYISRGEENRLKEIREKVSSLQETASHLEAQKKMVDEKNRDIEKQLANQKQRKRNLDDEKKIREKEVEATRVQKVIRNLEERIRGFDYDKLIDEKTELLEKSSRIDNQGGILDGRLQEVNKTIQTLESELRRKEIRDADKNYKQKFVEMKCTDVAADDLNKYYKALDTAIMRFHSDKMRTINSIIRELWRSTYRGNDIDYIEIQTDETESQGADKRRTYNYRVVMVKNGTEMDMRGRCSAGQKVLASLIIRMALAETFSTNCGILALDEPTTNLDRENIEALALALLDIVNKRASQENLQLIIITHDHEFLEKLGHPDYTDYFSLVERNDRGLSTITQKEISQL